jgi:hypothetical protein
VFISFPSRWLWTAGRLIQDPLTLTLKQAGYGGKSDAGGGAGVEGGGLIVWDVQVKRKWCSL